MEIAKIPTVFPDLKGRSGGKCGSKRWYRDRGNGDQNRPVLSVKIDQVQREHVNFEKIYAERGQHLQTGDRQ